MRIRLGHLLACGMAVVCLHVGEVSAQTTIILHDAGGVAGTPAEAAFSAAAHYWESVLTNNATIHIDVDYETLDQGVLASTAYQFYPGVTISSYQNALAILATSPLDLQATSHFQPLSTKGTPSVLLPAYYDPATKNGIATTGSRYATNGSTLGSTVSITSANLKAIVNNISGMDGWISLSNTQTYDFDPSNGITAGSYDLVGIAVHEIGHALGFDSGVDGLDSYTGPVPFVDSLSMGFAADLFRYSSPGHLDWRFNQDAYFSIDGGATAFNGNSYYSTGVYNGDGWEASHWSTAGGGCSGFVGVMNPYICPDTNAVVRAPDLAVLDAIGWNLSFNVLANLSYNASSAQIYQAYLASGAASAFQPYDPTLEPQGVAAMAMSPVPEPADWAMLLLGFVLIGFMLHRRGAQPLPGDSKPHARLTALGANVLPGARNAPFTGAAIFT